MVLRKDLQRGVHRAMNGKVQDVTVFLWMRIARIHSRLLQAATEHLQEWDLSPAQFDILAQVGAARNITQGELAKRLLVTQGNVTQLLDRMEERGLVQRHRDGRFKRVVLTDAGQRLHDQVVPEHELRMAAQFADLTSDERRQLAQLLRKLDRNLRN